MSYLILSSYVASACWWIIAMTSIQQFIQTKRLMLPILALFELFLSLTALMIGESL